MPANSPSNDIPKDQYQHYIPRFILRYFQDAQIQPRNKKERQKNFHKARKTGIDKDTILVYDIPNQTFEPQPVGKVHGIINMYRDHRNTQNVDHLEQGLSRSNEEERAGDRAQVHLPYALSTNIPHPLKKHGLHTQNDIFLFGMKYVLETSHHEMVNATEALWEKYGMKDFAMMLQTRVDPEIIDNFFAVDYATMADRLFLSIWQAAEGEEFVVADNSFGLWEGAIDGQPAIHRLFIVSPKIALVLRQTLFATEGVMASLLSQGAVVNSSLTDIPSVPASSTYANFTRPRGDVETVMRALLVYRVTPAAQEDVFTFKITTLTKKQTLALNHVVLLNVLDNGNVTFASPAAMQRTVESYLRSPTPYFHEKKYLYRGLSGILSEYVSVSAGGSSTSPDPRSGINVVLDSIKSGAIEFASTYDRGYRVYHLATDDVPKYNEATSEIHKMAARAILKMKEILPPPPIHHRGRYFQSLNTLVKRLPKEESELFFALIGYHWQVDVLGVGPTNSDLASRIKYEAAIIGFTHWLSEHHNFLLFERLFPWMNKHLGDRVHAAWV
ncbi:hypothetical protein BDZ97DRAFT_1925028 [Flammula alnicola]|nr:hypothetical protein BDZ97DRAFT_1925028 [Flammula alnicola]